MLHQDFYVYIYYINIRKNFVIRNNYYSNLVKSILDRCFQSKTRISTTPTKIDWDKNRSRSHSCMYSIEKCIQISRDVHVKIIIWSLNGIAVFGTLVFDFQIPGRHCRFARTHARTQKKKCLSILLPTKYMYLPHWCSCSYIYLVKW